MTYGKLCSIAIRGGEEVLIRAKSHCKISAYAINPGCLCYITRLIQDPDIPYIAGVEASLPVKYVDITLPLNDRVSVLIQNIEANVITRNFELV